MNGKQQSKRMTRKIPSLKGEPEECSCTFRREEVRQWTLPSQDKLDAPPAQIDQSVPEIRVFNAFRREREWW